MADELAAEIREQTGKHENRRLRKAGRIPVVLYGHGKENLSLSVAADELEAVVRRGSRLIDLRGAVSETAFLRELQWDTWGTHVLHVDFTRISAHEKVEADRNRVAIERGACYRALFFNPRTGAEVRDYEGRLHVPIHLGPVEPDADGLWPVPPKPTMEDWVPVLEDPAGLAKAVAGA